ncbi:MAG: UDP-N-acetylmuramoyl-tripeptide--D-alanyl-D-alanine ligase, partial [Bacteroidales bacterium]|nr:UDP-N-acetylmuramoyl-tripeptide--D-alanyl-D-alanine ligase [Bacteroidales bacterium]
MESTIERLYETYIKYPRVSTDSRNIPDDSIFFALKGESFNGNDFALDALMKGAKLAVVDDPGLKQDERLFFVEDVLAAFQQLALNHRKMLGLKVIAIT